MTVKLATLIIVEKDEKDEKASNSGQKESNNGGQQEALNKEALPAPKIS